MTEPLSPSQEAAVQEALYRLGPRNDRAERHQLSILRDLARRLLEPAGDDWLEKAAEEVGMLTDSSAWLSEALAILRRHRDGA